MHAPKPICEKWAYVDRIIDEDETRACVEMQGGYSRKNEALLADRPHNRTGLISRIIQDNCDPSIYAFRHARHAPHHFIQNPGQIFRLCNRNAYHHGPVIGHHRSLFGFESELLPCQFWRKKVVPFKRNDARSGPKKIREHRPYPQRARSHQQQKQKAHSAHGNVTCPMRGAVFLLHMVASSHAANIPLYAISRLVTIPAHYTTIPLPDTPAATCRIYNTALHQGDCGACAAFAVSTLLAMHVCLYDNEDFIPSPYRLFDCTNATCQQGLTFSEATAVVNFGVGDIRDSERRYGLPCDLRREFHRPNRQIDTRGIVISDRKQIKTALMLFGPLLGTMTQFPGYVRNRDTKFHAVVVVGWDNESRWIIQNSWGEGWGDGFGRGRIPNDFLLEAKDPSTTLVIRGCYISMAMCCLSMAVMFLCLVATRSVADRETSMC